MDQIDDNHRSFPRVVNASVCASFVDVIGALHGDVSCAELIGEIGSRLETGGQKYVTQISSSEVLELSMPFLI
jgi:hypothetical protein